MFLYTHTLLTLHALCHTKNRTNNYHISILSFIKPYDTSTLRSVITKTEPVVYAIYTCGRQGHDLFTHTFALEREMLNYYYVIYALYYLPYDPEFFNGCLLRLFIMMYLELILGREGYFVYCYVITIHVNKRGRFLNMICNLTNKCFTCNSIIQIILTYLISYDVFLTHNIMRRYLTGTLFLLNVQSIICLTQPRPNLTKSNRFASSRSYSFTSTQFLLING